MQTKIEKQPKSTIKITVTVPNADVKQTYEKLVDEAVKTTEVEGFRKGKAPRNVVEEKVGVSKLHGDLINNLLQKYYPQALKENKIAPLSNPKVEIREFDINKDFEFTALVATRPEVKMGDYKRELKKFYVQKKKDQSKANDEKLKKGEKLEDNHIHLTANEVIDVLINNSNLEVPQLLLDEETDRMMARLIDQSQTIGMSLDQYLKAQNKTADQLRTEYDQISGRNIKAELVMGYLIQKEGIVVENSEVEEMIKASGVEDTEERIKDPMETLYVKSILQKNKLITKLIEEAEENE